MSNSAPAMDLEVLVSRLVLYTLRLLEQGDGCDLGAQRTEEVVFNTLMFGPAVIEESLESLLQDESAFARLAPLASDALLFARIQSVEGGRTQPTGDEDLASYRYLARESEFTPPLKGIHLARGRDDFASVLECFASGRTTSGALREGLVEMGLSAGHADVRRMDDELHSLLQASRF